jgi:exoribonuclease R
MLRKVLITERNYENWSWFDGFTLESVECSLNPLEYKLFTDDIIETNEPNEMNENKQSVKIIHSNVRQMNNIPGILCMTGKTYGRYKNKKMYQCIPDDKRFPIFLIPYEDKRNSFQKYIVNYYVTFSFKEWNDKHPIGQLTNNIGSVEILSHFYEYQLYCKSLNATIQDFTKKTVDALKQRTEEEYIELINKNNLNIEDRTNKYIISIDPPKSLDIDDAFGIESIGDNEYILSIYIANVAVWIDTLSLWNSFSERISTIYLPDRKRPMLPNILSDCLCSLQENSKRFAYYIDVYINSNFTIRTITFGSSMIKVFKNYKYEEKQLMEDTMYISSFNLIQNLSKNVKIISSVKDSHDLINYLMVLFNSTCAEKLLEFKDGIYRSVTLNNNNNKREIPNNIPEDVGKFLTLWNCSSGQYSTFSEQQGHILVREGVESYIHISSPIRRLVDLLNSIKLQNLMNIHSFSDDAELFYNKWINRLDYINTTMRAIRKVQNDCSILNIINNDPDILKNIYEGYVFDKIKRNDGLYQYIVYLHKLKILSRITARNNLENYESVGFKLFVFNDEVTLKRKIRLQIM